MVGLTYIDERHLQKQVPLTSVNIDVNIVDCLSATNVTQIYINGEPYKINCSYAFNLDKNSVITGLFVTFSSNGRKLKGEIREKTQARATYTSGVERGKKACLLQDFGNGHYNVEIGNVDIDETVVISYTYVGYVDSTIDGYRYLFPTNIMQKYSSHNFTRNPYADQKTTYTTSPTYTFELAIKWKSGAKITDVRHNMTIPVGQTIVNDNERTIRMSSEPSSGDLSITLVTEIHPNLYVQRMGDDTYSMMSTKIEKSVEKKKYIRDYVFVLDRSGSMMGDKIVSAVAALKLFVQSLPSESYFNIVSFGNRYSSLFPQSQKYTDANREVALIDMANYSADMGGTEILSVLKYIGETPFEKDVNERIIVLLTDGGVNNENDVVNYAKVLENTRIFTIGVGSDVSRSLVERVASATHATCVCVVDSPSLDDTLMDVLETTTLNYYTDLTTEYYSDVGKIPIVSSLTDAKYVYPGSYFKSFNLLKSAEMDKVTKVVVKGTLSGDNSVSEWTIEPSKFVSADIDKFYAMKCIASVANISTNEAVAICVKHSIMSPRVSMVMVDDASTSSTGEATNVVVPHSAIKECGRECASASRGVRRGCADSDSDSDDGRGVRKGYAYYDDDSDDGRGGRSKGYTTRDVATRGIAISAGYSSNVVEQSGQISKISVIDKVKQRLASVKSKFFNKTSVPAPYNTASISAPIPAISPSLVRASTQTIVPTPGPQTAPVDKKLLDFQRADGSFDICPELLSLLKIDETVISDVMTKTHSTRVVAIYNIILDLLSKEHKYRLAHLKTKTYVTNALCKPAPSSA